MISSQNLEAFIVEQAKQMADQMPRIASLAGSEEDVRHECNSIIDNFLKIVLKED